MFNNQVFFRVRDVFTTDCSSYENKIERMSIKNDIVYFATEGRLQMDTVFISGVLYPVPIKMKKGIEASSSDGSNIYEFECERAFADHQNITLLSDKNRYDGLVSVNTTLEKSFIYVKDNTFDFEANDVFVYVESGDDYYYKGCFNGYKKVKCVDDTQNIYAFKLDGLSIVETLSADEALYALDLKTIPPKEGTPIDEPFVYEPNKYIDVSNAKALYGVSVQKALEEEMAINHFKAVFVEGTKILSGIYIIQSGSQPTIRGVSNDSILSNNGLTETPIQDDEIYIDFLITVKKQQGTELNNVFQDVLHFDVMSTFEKLENKFNQYITNWSPIDTDNIGFSRFIPLSREGVRQDGEVFYKFIPYKIIRYVRQRITSKMPTGVPLKATHFNELI